MPLTMRSIRSGATARLRSATSIEVCSLSRSKAVRRPERLTTVEFAQLHPLEGGEAAAAIGADAAAADRGGIVGRAGILHLRVEGAAIGTAHGGLSELASGGGASSLRAAARLALDQDGQPVPAKSRSCDQMSAS